jgi:protein-tyrosine phosphatase
VVCTAGISRSAAIIISYLIKTHKMSYEKAFQTVKQAEFSYNLMSDLRGYLKAMRLHIVVIYATLKRKHSGSNNMGKTYWIIAIQSLNL